MLYFRSTSPLLPPTCFETPSILNSNHITLSQVPFALYLLTSSSHQGICLADPRLLSEVDLLLHLQKHFHCGPRSIKTFPKTRKATSGVSYHHLEEIEPLLTSTTTESFSKCRRFVQFLIRLPTPNCLRPYTFFFSGGAAASFRVGYYPCPSNTRVGWGACLVSLIFLSRGQWPESKIWTQMLIIFAPSGTIFA